MGFSKLGPGQYLIDAPGSYTVDVDDTNITQGIPFLRLEPGVPYITVHLRGRYVGGFGPLSEAPCIRGRNNAALTIIGEGVNIRGFKTAVELIDCYLTRISGLTVQDTLLAGIQHSGNDGVFFDNDISNIGGYAGNPNARAFGINSAGRVTIRNNSVRNVFCATEEAVGISINDDGHKGIIAGNVVINDQPAPPTPRGLPGSWGLWIGGGPEKTDVDVAHNLVSGFSVGIGASTPTKLRAMNNSFPNCIEPVRVAPHHVLAGNV
jgi:hypothetical protein